MAYNLYQVQGSNGWKQRIAKETATAEKFWTDQALGTPQQQQQQAVQLQQQSWDVGSAAGSKASSAAPTGYTSKTSYLKSRLDQLEGQLHTEREQRMKVEQDLESLRSSQQLGGGSRPVTPRTPKY